MFKIEQILDSTNGLLLLRIQPLRLFLTPIVANRTELSFSSRTVLHSILAAPVVINVSVNLMVLTVITPFPVVDPKRISRLT